MLGDAVIILANMRGGYVDIGSTVHTLFRMTGRRRNATEERDCIGASSDAVADERSNSSEPTR